MVQLTIDNQSIEVNDGATILDAAAKLGIEIPTMCFLNGCTPSTSCMVCMVRLADSGKMVPACGTIVAEGMTVVNDCDQVRQARITALELLLSDHAGDCMGPCQIGCPAKMNIPLMIRQIAAGDLDRAIATIKEDIALPAVLGRICPAPCEKVCRKNQLDEALSICLLKRYAAGADLDSPKPYKPKCAPANRKRIAIAGAGPAGLSAAYYLARKGYACTIFDDHDKPGGALRYEIERNQLPGDVLDKEIAQIIRLGVKFQPNTRIGKDKSLDKLCKSFNAVFLAVGKITPEEIEQFGLKAAAKGIAVDSNTYQTDRGNIFAGGDAIRDRKRAVRSVADGKEAAIAIDQYLSSKNPTGPEKPFNTRIGRLEEAEVERFKACASDAARQTPTDSQAGFSPAQAAAESSRCLHCDCRKPDACKLRKYSHEYHARPGRYKGPRRLFAQQTQHSEVIYESGKCIDCGLCIQITAQQGEKLGLTFVGRGFNVRVAVPFDRTIADALEHTAKKCANACPTGALALRQKTCD